MMQILSAQHSPQLATLLEQKELNGLQIEGLPLPALDKFRFENVNMRRCQLNQCQWQRSAFHQLRMNGCLAIESQFTSLKFDRCEFIDSDFRNSSFTDCSFEQTEFNACDLSYTHWDHCTFIKSASVLQSLPASQRSYHSCVFFELSLIEMSQLDFSSMSFSQCFFINCQLTQNQIQTLANSNQILKTAHHNLEARPVMPVAQPAIAPVANEKGIAPTPTPTPTPTTSPASRFSAIERGEVI